MTFGDWFTNFGQHFRFRFIPRNEFWIDQEHGPGEQQFFIDHLLVEHRLMAGAMGYDKALVKADALAPFKGQNPF